MTERAKRYAVEDPKTDAARPVSDAEPYLTFRPNRDGTRRYYFQPHGRDRSEGWKAMRLYDAKGIPIRDRETARWACKRLATIYKAWQQKKPGYGPECIDVLGRPIAKNYRLATRVGDAVEGTVAAIVRDYLASRSFAKRKPSTQGDYLLCLKALVEEFGPRMWRSIERKEAQDWVEAKAKGKPSMAHQLYRTCRAVLNKTHLVYPKNHPGFVSRDDNPFARLEMALPQAPLIVWPQEAIQAMVAIADELGRPSLGDAMLMMSYLGVRRQDWLAWPANIFDTPYLAWTTQKTNAAVTIPWTQVPQLRERIEAAKARHRAASVRSTVFFVDDRGPALWSHGSIHKAFSEVRAELGRRHDSFPTRYAVNLYPGDPMRVPTSKLTMRVLRHTCITALHDAGCIREQIRSITGHSMSSIDEILKRYTALTVDQAGTALARLNEHHERQKVGWGERHRR